MSLRTFAPTYTEIMFDPEKLEFKVQMKIFLAQRRGFYPVFLPVLSFVRISH